MQGVYALDTVALSAFVVCHFFGGWHGFRGSRQKGDKGGSVLKMPFMGWHECSLQMKGIKLNVNQRLIL